MKNTFLLFTFFLLFSTSFAQVNLTNGLVAYYPFNGSANDLSGNANNPIFNNAVSTTDQYGNANSAYHFDGATMYMKIPDSATLNTSDQISLVAIIKPEGFYGGPCHGNDIINKGEYENNLNSFFLRFDDYSYTSRQNCSNTVVDEDHQNFYGWGTATPPGYNPYIQKDQWYCVVYTYDGTTAKLYVDGILKSQADFPGLSFNNSHDLYFGRLYDPSDPAIYPYWFKGVMDEIRIYNRAINSQEVTALCTLFPLPVTLANFETNVVGKQIKLTWSIDNEEAINKYVIERSLTPQTGFIEIGSKAAVNHHMYSFIDNTVDANKNYFYRLAVIEKNSTVKYSGISTSRINGNNKHIVIFPNPSNGNITAAINDYTGIAKFTIINSVGQVIFRKTESIRENNPIKLKLSKQAKGIYWLRVETGAGKSFEKILIR